MSRTIKRLGLVIAGTNSGCGKTTISNGIMAALIDKGLKLQPYKIGPDYIDPMFHTFITNRKSRNLDSWILNERTLKHLYIKSSNDVDISIVEGVMGLYDGYGITTLEGSTADVSKILGLPVILVIDCSAMSLSAAALVKGFVEFDESTNIRGVIINNISSESHYKLLKQAIENNTKVKVLGFLRRTDGVRIEHRHLGLVTSAEVENLRSKIDLLSRQIQQTVDLEQLIDISKQVAKFEEKEAVFSIEKVGKVRIAVAKDKAFNFYYEDNFDLLKMMGAEIVFFSPMNDKFLPQDIDGLYIGGGYPEIWANELQSNISMRNDIKRCIKEELPVYAECGGLMYLTNSIKCINDEELEMVGAIDGKSYMTQKLRRFGYVFVKMTEDNIIAKKGCEIRAHEFHYSNTNVQEQIKSCFEVSKRENGVITRSWNCGFKLNKLLAAYTHIHFWVNTDIARRFIESCMEKGGNSDN